MSRTQSGSRFNRVDSCTDPNSNKIKVTLDGADIQALIAANSIVDDTNLNGLLEEIGTEIEIYNQVEEVFKGSRDIAATGHIQADKADDILGTLNKASERSGFHIGQLESIASDLRVEVSTPEDTETEPPTWEANFDGASKGNPGPSSVGAVLKKNGDRIDTISREVTEVTNNVAEYLALEAVLELVADHNIDSVTIYGDSQLIINQVRGDWNANDKLSEYRDLIQKEMGSLDCNIELEQVGREENREADKLANKAFE